jgi:hypothetical protein
MRDIAKRKVVLASGASAVSHYPTGTVFIIIGDTRGNLTRSCYSGFLLVSRPEGLIHISFSVYFVPLDPLKKLATGDVGIDDILSEERIWHVELPEEFAFFTVIREPDACAHLSPYYGADVAQNLLLVANDIASLDGLAMKPQWYRHEMHDYVYGDDFGAALKKWTGYEDKSTSAMKAERLAVQLDSIPIGKDGAAAFEDWCYQVIGLLFKERCDPVYLRPNGLAADRRDIVATNIGKSVFCERILRDYGARHVLFEVKNSAEVDVDAMRQVLAYTGSSYGTIAFLISRNVGEGLDQRDKWHFRNMRNKGILVVQLSTAFLLKVLGSVARCEGPCAIDRQFGMLLDRYLLEYVNEPPPRKTTS